MMSTLPEECLCWC